MVSLLLLACSTPEAPPEKPAVDAEKPVEAAPTEALVVYSGRSESLVGPLIERIEKEVGFPIEVQYGKTAEMVTRLVTEGAESPADVVFAQDSGHLGVLAGQKILAPLPTEVLETVDSRFRDPEGSWVGTSGRLRVLVYDSEAVPVEDLPKSLKDLADPKWKGKLGWAPTNSSLHAHVSALRHSWGEDETKTWLQGVMANEPRVYPKNSPQVKAANEGEIALGWVNHYYLHRVPKEGRRAAVASFAAGDAGNVLMVAGVGIRKGAKHEQQARTFIEALLSEESQAYFATESYEYPTRPGVKLHEDVTPLADDTLFDVDQKHLADLAPTRKMLQELGLL